MSRAFVREGDDDGVEPLPELIVSPHRNLVTEDGLALIESNVTRLETELEQARSVDDRATVARAARDLRYWSQRRATAELVPPERSANRVRFGCQVTLETPDGGRRRYRIVGEDEADPAQGRLSYVSPIAARLLGSTVGDVVDLHDGEAEIVEIDAI
jgi:transcription elongation GreA/GreB family factor